MPRSRLSQSGRIPVKAHTRAWPQPRLTSSNPYVAEQVCRNRVLEALRICRQQRNNNPLFSPNVARLTFRLFLSQLASSQRAAPGIRGVFDCVILRRPNEDFKMPLSYFFGKVV